VKITLDIIPLGNNRRGAVLAPAFITIHETGNSAPGADALMHSKYIKSAECVARPASWHFTVDAHSIYQHIPTNEQAIHAGTRAGNVSSIGIELCINSDGDFEQTKKNTQWLVGELMSEFGLTIDKIRQHFDWSGKDCPATIRRTNTWQAFLDGIGEDENMILELKEEIRVLTAEVNKQKGYVTALRSALDAERRLTAQLKVQIEIKDGVIKVRDVTIAELSAEILTTKSQTIAKIQTFLDSLK
jgi:N-acetylmuramoyl-L-alanine amidase